MYHLIDYVWCVEKFSQYFEPHEQEVYPLLTSPIFAYKNTRWVLNLYPEGLGDSASQGYISLFIKYVSEDPETINAKVELSLLNNKNERVYCRDTGDHQYQTFIDFGYKQFLKIQDIKDQKDDLIFNGQLKIFARVEFEHATLPSSLTWSNYDLLLFKENFKDLYETKNLCDIVIKVVKKPVNSQQNLLCRNSQSQMNFPTNQSCIQNSTNTHNFSTVQSTSHLHQYHPYSVSQKCSPTVQNQFSKLKRPGSNNLESTPIIQNVSLAEFISPFSPFSPSTFNSEYISTSESPLSCNSILSNKLTRSTDSNNNSTLDEEILDIKAHKFILASRSGKFRELLKTNLIKLCKLNSVSLSCDQCLKMSMLHESCSNDNTNSLNAGGCSSINCLYKNNNNKNNNNNQFNNVNTAYNFNNTNNGSTSTSNNEATSAVTSSEVLCSSSYPSCSTTSSSSSTSLSQEACKCSCTCQKTESNSTLPSSSFLSSSSSQETLPCPIHEYQTIISAAQPNLCCYHDNLEKQPHANLLVNANSEDPDITDLLIIETDRSPKVIEYLIRYMYTGYLDSLDSFSKDIYEISKEYKVHGLTNLAREHIIKELNIQNCCDYLVFCVINNDYELNNKIQVFIAENYETIVKTNAYKQAKRKYRELFENTFNEIFKKIPTLNKANY